MEMERNEKALYSHRDFVAHFFEKVIFGIINPRRRSILEALSQNEAMSDKDLQQCLKREGFGRNSKKRIRDYYLTPLVDARMVEGYKDSSYKITPFGKEIAGVVSGFEEFDLLPVPVRQRLLLEIRESRGKAYYWELKSRLNLGDGERAMKQLKDRGFIKVNHPENSLYTTFLSYFTISPYYYFIQGIKNFTKRVKRNWFTEYSIVTHLNLQWRRKFSRALEIEECHELLEKGIKIGDIKKTDGSYTITSIRDLTSSEREIFSLIEEGYKLCMKIAEKSGFHWAHVYRLLRRLERKGVIERKTERITIELTEKGRKLTDILLKIKESLIQEGGVEE